MALQLYPHNQTAYNAAMEMLEKEGRAAIIHPTGTGKSFLAFQLAFLHPDDIVLWLAPSEYIYRTQLKNLAGAMEGFAPEMLSNVRFMTYARLMGELDWLSGIHIGWIVLDEFHRAGSPQWGKGVRKLLRACPDAKRLGLTATHIRYLDQQRDMAAELFGGHIASELSLGEAMARGILPAPTYVISLYSCQEDLNCLEKRICAMKNKKARLKNQERFEQLRRALRQAEGLDQIFERHMKNPHGKYLVFCQSREHMAQMMEQSREWFARIDKRPHMYGIAYDDPDAAKQFEAFQKDGSSHLRLLFSIDMLNEGVHVNGVDGVILLRPTVSPALYLQQIGRALSAGGREHPVIFDIVDNFRSLRSIDCIQEEADSYFLAKAELKEERERFWGRFRVIDEAADCKKLVAQIEASLSAGWESYYLEAKRFFEEHGHLQTPKSYVAPSGVALGAWILTQRRAYQGKTGGRLSDLQVMRLNAIGMVWESRSESVFESRLSALRSYVKEHGNADVPAGYLSEDGTALGKWVSNVRQRYKGVSGKALTEGQIDRLNALGMIWDKAGYAWERNFEKAKEYFLQHGNLRIPREYIADDGTALGVWLSNQRNIAMGRKKGAKALQEGQVRRLEEIGMEWGRPQDENWDERYRLAKRYWNEHGNIRIPASYVTEDGQLLGKWLVRQREQCRNRTLKKERRELLSRIGMEWEKK